MECLSKILNKRQIDSVIVMISEKRSSKEESEDEIDHKTDTLIFLSPMIKQRHKSMGSVQWKQVSFSGCSLKKVCCSQILSSHFFIGVSRGVGGNKRESPFKNKVILEQIGRCVSLGACLPGMHRLSLYIFFIAFVPFPLRCLNLNLFTFHSHRLYMQKSQFVYLFNDCTIHKM